MKKFTILFLAGSLLALSPSLHAQVLLSDNFNTENGGVPQLNYNSFANWIVANSVSQGGTVDLIGNGYFDFYPGNGLYIDLDGSGNGVPGLLETKTTFGAGTYTFSFDLAGSARGMDEHVDVNFGPYSQTFFVPNSQPYTLYTETVTLTTPAPLSFQNVEPGDVGAILDNVTVSENSVPDAGSTAMLTAGAVLALAAVGARSRKCVTSGN
jgi:hypothetical protein